MDSDCTTELVTTDKVRELCNNKQTCSIDASQGSTLFSDPCPNVSKQLKVWYQCVKLPS